MDSLATNAQIALGRTSKGTIREGEANVVSRNYLYNEAGLCHSGQHVEPSRRS